MGEGGCSGAAGMFINGCLQHIGRDEGGTMASVGQFGAVRGTPESGVLKSLGSGYAGSAVQEGVGGGRGGIHGPHWYVLRLR